MSGLRLRLAKPRSTLMGRPNIDQDFLGGYLVDLHVTREGRLMFYVPASATDFRSFSFVVFGVMTFFISINNILELRSAVLLR